MPLSSFQTNIISLIQSALTGTQPSISTDMNLQEIFDFGKKQQILPLLLESLYKVPRFEDSEDYTKWFQTVCRQTAYGHRQLQALDKIIDAFNQERIDHIVLKGGLLKRLYPKQEMRVMGDADILIHMEQYPHIREIMLHLGYEEGSETDNELHWNKPGVLNVELHKRLVPSYNLDYNAYYDTGWRVFSDKTHSVENSFIFMIVHFAKHYRDRGAGIKYVLDFRIYQQSYPQMDMAYIFGELEKMKLDVFYQNIERMLSVWFDGVQPDEISLFLTDKLFDGGAWGKANNAILSNGLKLTKTNRYVRLAKIKQAMFPDFISFSARYPVLKKYPILTPAFHIYRWITKLLFQPDRVAKQIEITKSYAGDGIQLYQKELNYVGLDYNFGCINDHTKKQP